MRMLDSLHGGRSASPRRAATNSAGPRRWPWALGGLALVAVPVVIAALMNTASHEPHSPAMAAAESTRVDDKVPAMLGASEAPAGPAKVEASTGGLAALPGMERAVAAQHSMAERSMAEPPATSHGGAMADTLPAPADTPSAVGAAGAVGSASAVGAASAVAAAPRTAPVRPAKRTAHASTSIRGDTGAKPVGRGARAGPEAAAAAAGPDPDAELVAAIMARLETRGGSATASRGPDRSNTIAALVRDCQALPDPADALACRRRICDGYWGQAQACPKSLVPSAKAHTAAVAAGGELVSR